MNEALRHVLQAGIGIWLQSTWLLILGLAFGALVRRRGALASSAAYRGTLVSVVVSAILGATLAGHIRPLVSINLPPTAASTPTPTTLSIQKETSPSPWKGEEVGKTLAVSTSASTTTVPPVAVTTAHLSTPPARMPVYGIIVAVWAAFAIIQLVWLFCCHLWLSNLRRGTTLLTDGPAVEILRDLAARLQVRAPALLTSDSVGSPFVAGVFRPSIYLPAHFANNLPTVELRAILSHELAHVRQNDCLWNVVFRLITALLWPQPLIWVLRRRWQESAEQVCDQWVLSFECPPSVYADCLLRLAAGLSTPGRGLRPDRVAGVGVFSFKSLLGRRIQAILARTQFRLLSLSRRARTAVALGTLAAAVATVFLVSTPARSMVRKQVHRLSALTVVAEKQPDRHAPAAKRSLAHMKKMPHKPLLLPTLLALAGGAVQVNLPADASTQKQKADVAAAAVKPASPKSNDVIIVADGNVRIHTPAGTMNVVKATPTPTTDSIKVSYPIGLSSLGSSGYCTFDFQNMPVKQALRQFFDAYHLQYAIDDNIKGSVNISMHDVEMLPAFRSILKASTPPLAYDLADGFFHVHVKLVDDSTAAPAASQSDEDNTSFRPYRLPVAHLTAEQALAGLKAAGSLDATDASGRKAIALVNRNENALMLQCSPMLYAGLREALKAIDVPQASVSVELKIVTSSASEIAKIGLDPSKAVDDLSATDTAKVQAAMEAGKLHVQEAPVLTTTAGIPATISVKQNGPVPTGTTVSVTPTRFSNDTISTSIHFEDTNADGPKSVSTHTQTVDVNQVFMSGETCLVAAVQEGSGQVRLLFAKATLLPDVSERMAAGAVTPAP